jgi:ribosomal protein L37AE/L43A
MIGATWGGAGRDNRRVTSSGPPDALAVNPCRSLCQWVATRRAPHALFACQGCGSQWRPGEAWTPVDADGTVPPAVRRAKHGLTTARPGGGTGSGGR